MRLAPHGTPAREEEVKEAGKQTDGERREAEADARGEPEREWSEAMVSSVRIRPAKVKARFTAREGALVVPAYGGGRDHPVATGEETEFSPPRLCVGSLR